MGDIMAERPLEELSYRELLEEIKREEEEQAARRRILGEIDAQIDEIDETIRSEGLLKKEEEYEWRLKKIEELRRALGEFNKQIDRVLTVIRGYNAEIARIESLIAEYEARRRSYIVSAFDRYYASLRIPQLRRSRAALRGHVTRQRSILEQLQSLRRWVVGQIGGHSAELKRRTPLHERLRRLIADRNRLDAERRRLIEAIATEDVRLKRKHDLLPAVTVSRVQINLYIIIERGEHEYPRTGDGYQYRKPRSRRVRVRRKYPKGSFQSWWEMDAIKSQETGKILVDEDPFRTLLPLVKQDTAREFMELFNLSAVEPNMLTLGETSEIPDETEIGKPPLKLQVERTVEDDFGTPWSQTVDEYLMSDEEYDRLTRNMAMYRQLLEAMG